MDDIEAAAESVRVKAGAPIISSQPPVEVIQGEARALVSEAVRAWNIIRGNVPARINGAEQDLNVALGALLLAFQSEARAGEGVGYRMHAMHEAISPDLGSRAKEVLAVAMEPHFPAEAEMTRKGLHFMLPSSWAVEANNAALATIAKNATVAHPHPDREAIAVAVEQARFLCARLDDLDWCEPYNTARDFAGHVDPALSRLKSTLGGLSPTPSAGRGGIEMTALICWLFHGDRYWWPVHHSWGWKCKVCGREGVSDD